MNDNFKIWLANQVYMLHILSKREWMISDDPNWTWTWKEILEEWNERKF